MERENKVYTYDEAFKSSLEYFDGDELAAKVFVDKYALKNENGNILESNPNEMHKRLAKEFARIEKKYPNPMSEDEIFSLMKNFKYILPQGSPMSAIGNPYHIQSSGNCFSIKPPYDSYGGIFFTDQQMAQLMKRRCVEENSIVSILGKGTIPIKNVKKGDYILSFNINTKKDEYKKIINIFESNVDVKDRLKITFSNGTIFKTSKKHPVLNIDENGYNYKRSSLIKEGDVCIKPSFQTSNCFKFNKKLSDIAWYIGSHVGDGTAGRIKGDNNFRLRILGDNEAVVKKYSEITNLLSGSNANYCKTTKKYYKTQCWEYTCNKKSVSKIISKYFDKMVGQKVYSVKTPSFISKHNLWIPFIAGIIDTDGHIRDYGSIDISMCSKVLIDEISSYLSSVGISYKSSFRYPRRENEKIMYRVQIHVNKKILHMFEKYMVHDLKKNKIKEAVYREFSHKKFITQSEKEDIIKNYNNTLCDKKDYYKIKKTLNQKKSRYNLSAIIGLLKKGKNIGVGAMNSFCEHSVISLDKREEMSQRIFVKKIEKDNNSEKYIDIEVEDNNNFYAGNFGMINVHNCGVGTSLSTLRPKGLSVKNAAKTTDGISIFMDRYSNTCREVAQGSRRGALILLLNVHHPEIKTFINIKNNTNRITGANLSIQVTDEFMNAVKNNDEFELRWPVDSNAPIIKQRVSAKEIWDNFIDSNWSWGEPGILFWDTVIKNSVSNCYGAIDENFYDVSCNPCGEIVMGIDSCRLLALNSYSFVVNKFEKNAFFDFEKFSIFVQKAQKMMDDMVDLELELIRKIINKIDSDPEPDNIKFIERDTWEMLYKTCEKGRRTGLGITGLGDAIAALNIRYGSNESIEITEKIYKTLCINAYKQTCVLAKERGAFPIFSYDVEKNNLFLNKIFNESDEVYDLYKKYGRRNIALTTTPPAGSLSILTQTTSGIEPAFTIGYKRRKKINPTDEGVRVDFVDKTGDSWQIFDVYHHGFKKWMEVTGKTNYEESPYFKATSNDVDWESSVDIQAAAQKWICHALSKTCNVPKDTPKETIEKVYMRAWEKGCKGFTIYRDGCRDGVLFNDKKEDLSIQYHDAPKRPKKLPCDIFHVSVKGTPYFVLVGKLNENPYEVFAGEDKDNIISKSLKSGNIIKKARGQYCISEESDDEKVIHNNISTYIGEDYEAITRLISSNLRHGCNVNFVVHQLEKTRGDFMSFSKAIARVLKKYIKEGEAVSGEECPQCGEKLIRVEGCVSCKSCSWSKC